MLIADLHTINFIMAKVWHFFQTSGWRNWQLVVDWAVGLIIVVICDIIFRFVQ